MKRIRNQFTLYVVSLIILCAGLFEMLIIAYSGNFFYAQLDQQINTQAQNLASALEMNLVDSNMGQVLGKHSDLIGKMTSYEVQIYNEQGELILDTFDSWTPGSVQTPDVINAFSGASSNWSGWTENTANRSSRKVYSVAYPLDGAGQIKGVLRLVAPAGPIEQQIWSLAGFFILLGLVAVVVSSLGTYILADAVTMPIQRLIQTTRKMAAGDFTEKALAPYNDEVGELAGCINHFAEEIQKKEYLKNKMFSSVSHELRTPLTAIRGWSETLNDPMYTRGSTELEDGLKVITEESIRLQQMVEELLDFSRLSAIEMTYRFEKVQLDALLRLTESILSPKAKQRGVDLVLEMEFLEESSFEITADEHRIKQLLLNLADNAIKFTPSGGTVTFELSCESDYVTFKIKDTGCGIAKEEIPLIKERFYKGTHSNSHLGLGLAICEEIVKAHRGHWVIDSVLGEGTKMIIRLPKALENL